MPPTLPPNFLLCAQVDTNICRGTSIDEPCILEEFLNSKDEFTDKEYFWLKQAAPTRFPLTPDIILNISKTFSSLYFFFMLLQFTTILRNVCCYKI